MVGREPPRPPGTDRWRSTPTRGAARRGSASWSAPEARRPRPASGAPRTPARGGHPAAGASRSRTTPPRTPRPSAARADATPDPTRRTLRWRIKIALVVASTLVMTLTGAAWGLYRDITAGITTTDVIAGGGDGGAQNILLVGVDSRTDAQGNPLPPEVQEMLSSGADTGVLNSDTIILLHVPEGGGAAIAFSVPRDSYVDIPGYRRDKINAAYPVTKARAAGELRADGVRDPERIEAESARTGRSTLIRAVEGLTGLTVDHYAEINLLGFYNLTNAIGGVDVCLRNPVNDVLSGAHFAAGPQTISGADALAFVRQRHGLPDGDLSRIRRQQVFLAAVADKILSAGTLTDPGTLGSLIEVAQQSLVIDEGWDLLAFAQQASDIAAGNIEFMTIPTQGLDTNARGDVVLVDRGEVRSFVDQQIAEQQRAAEEAREEPPPPPPPVDVIASRYVVDVRNGSDTSGLAAAVDEHMRNLGFTPGTVDNTEPTETSVVRYTGSDEEAAQAVAEQLGGIDVESSSEITRGHLLVVLGADFDPAVVPTMGEPTPTPTAEAEEEVITAAGVPCID
ncbi:LCP family protein [Pseudonocardia nigra]|uniref:LCP family protein n=1 Tax=Pseudonocardia nigra TaxID=1921578 RepID=UPI001C5E848B|nr:LCP family protein [Pseudonocardia nigra]